MKRTHYSYCIFYLENKYYQNINKDLKESGYHHIRAIVPTIRFITKNSSRGKDVYQEEPLLFNYGFLKIPTSFAYNRQFLNKLKKRITGIRGWLKNTESLHRKRGKKARVENAEDFDDFSQVAMVSRKEVRRFLQISRENKRLSVEDISSVHVGDYIELRHYPYIGADAVVKEVDLKKDRIKLQIYPQSSKVETWLPMDMVVYSIYENYDPRKLLADQCRKAYDVDRISNESLEARMNLKKSKRNRKRKDIMY